MGIYIRNRGEHMINKQTEQWQKRICAIFIEHLKTAKENARKANGTKLVWIRPWRNITQKSFSSGHVYQGFNQLLLSLVSHVMEYPDSRWLTYNQLVCHNRECEPDKQWHIPENKIALEGGHLFAIRYLKIRYRLKNKPKYYSAKEKDELIAKSSGRLHESDFTVTKSIGYHRVYNAGIVEGIDPDQAENFEPEEGFEKGAVGRFLASEHLRVVHAAQNRAFYDWGQDKIVLPLRSSFKNEKAYYATLLHEIAHAIGASHRLDRSLESFESSTESYAIEELVAELTSVFLVSHLKITNMDDGFGEFDNNLAYLDSWIATLKQRPEVLWDVLEQGAAAFDYFIEHSQE